MILCWAHLLDGWSVGVQRVSNGKMGIEPGGENAYTQDPIDIFGLVSQFVLGSNKKSDDAAGEEGAQPAEGATSQ